MEKFDWRSMIKMNILVLRCVGLWPSGEETYKPGVYTIYASTVLSIFLLGHIFFQAVNIYFIRNNLSAVTGTVYILLIEILLVFKVYYLMKNMTVLKQLLKMLETEMFQPRNSAQISEIQADMKFWQRLIRFLWISVICSNLFWAIYPLLDNAGQERRFPFLAWYPYDAQKSPYYEITYVYQTISVNYMSSIHVSVDALAGALNVYNGNQFDILCDNLRNLHKLTTNGKADAGRNFRYCLKHHKQILDFAKKCNNYLNWILFMQFFVSTISIGITMFQLTVVRPFSNEFYSLFTYISAIIGQIFMYCWYGNEVEVKSSKIFYATFESDWIEFSEQVKKELLFFVMRTQKPVKLSALNLFYLNLDSFMRILKTSWSYFALLHQVSNRNS